MRKILLVAAIALSGCGKKASAPKHDCASAVANAVKISGDEYKRNGVSDATRDKIRDVSVARCGEDKWSEAMLTCLADAKQTEDVSKCQQMMSKDQSDNMAKAISAAMAATETGSGAQVSLEGSAGSGSGTGGGAEASAPIAGLPASCNDYKAMIEKLGSCEKLPQASREMLKQAFDETSKAWANFEKLPDDAKAALENGCKQGADALKQTAGVVCSF